MAVLNPRVRATVGIAGSASNAGKTWLGEALLRGLASAGFLSTALKVTRTHLDTCPRENDGCGVCDDLTLPYRVVTDLPSLDVSGKDTGRYLSAGATEVIWLLVQPAHMGRAIDGTVPRVAPGHVLVAEGNSFCDWVSCDLTLMVLTEASAPKPTAHHLLERVDAFVAEPTTVEYFRKVFGEDFFRDRMVLMPDEAARWAIERILP